MTWLVVVERGKRGEQMSKRATAAVKTPEVKPTRSISRKRHSEMTASSTPFHEQVAVLQRFIGNRGVSLMYRSGILKAKLRIGPPNDIYEQEADRVAEQVMRMPEPAIQTKPG
jgi:hypothetical protein